MPNLFEAAIWTNFNQNWEKTSTFITNLSELRCSSNQTNFLKLTKCIVYNWRIKASQQGGLPFLEFYEDNIQYSTGYSNFLICDKLLGI